MLIVLFYLCLATVTWAYIGYPALVVARGLVWRRPFRKEPITPAVSLVIVCHNEERSIGAKLDNVLALDYPADRLEVVIASDGSTDGTEEIVRRCADARVRLLCLPRAGKAAALNAAVGTTSGEILVFSDANSQYAVDALRHIVQPFADPQVGGVAGNQMYRKTYDAGAAASGERTYWKFDRMLKVFQSRSGNVISATGAIYAIRSSLFRPVPDGVTDDFVTSTRVIEQGRRLVFEPEAVCHEPVAGAAWAEFGRKVRVITRGLRGVLVMRRLLNPFRFGFYSLQLASHKVLRRLVALPLLALAIVSPLLWERGPDYQAATIVQAVFYGAGLCGLLLSLARQKAPKPFAIPFYFCMVNAAVLAAVWNLVRGRKITVWNPHRGEQSVPTRPSMLAREVTEARI